MMPRLNLMLKPEECEDRVQTLQFNERWKCRSSEHSSRWHGSDWLILHNSEGIDRAQLPLFSFYRRPYLSSTLLTSVHLADIGYRDESQIWNLTRLCGNTPAFSFGVGRSRNEKKFVAGEGSYYVAAQKLTADPRIASSAIKSTQKRDVKKKCGQRERRKRRSG